MGSNILFNLLMKSSSLACLSEKAFSKFFLTFRILERIGIGEVSLSSFIADSNLEEEGCSLLVSTMKPSNQCGHVPSSVGTSKVIFHLYHL
ncbi:unnamed protein product [Moneuplotes crassus]|uniref:Uncharacterized protein n=1 Tax=Euplotes crassus TaxID=5936 RepID=A0AAD2D5G3_EUPCR|nr:unnamed protein product [Moneuplotes crassus]